MVKKYSPFWSVLPYYVRCLILKLFIKSGTKKKKHDWALENNSGGVNTAKVNLLIFSMNTV